MSWQCNFCDTRNTTDIIACEVCGAIPPILSKFDYIYIGNEKVEISWFAVNALEIEVYYNNNKYNVTNWKSARVALKSSINVIMIKIKNNVTERTYSFGISLK